MSYWDSFANFLGFGVEDEVGNGRANRDDDVLRVQSLLRDIGYYPSDRETRGIIDRDMDEGIRRFQKDSGLRVDGWLGRDGETANALRADARRTLETGRVLKRNDGRGEDKAESSNSVRFDGAMQLMGGLAQMGAGALGIVAPEPIVTTALGTGALAIGADNAWTGGEKTNS